MEFTSNIAPQTKVAIIGFILILFAKILYMIQNTKSAKTFIPILFIYLITAALSLYVINCTVVGKCYIYAWIVSYIAAIFGIGLIFSYVFVLSKK
jgi:hypothetical protein